MGESDCDGMLPIVLDGRVIGAGCMPTMRIVPVLDVLKHCSASLGRRAECATFQQLALERGEEIHVQRPAAQSNKGTALDR